MDCNFLQQKPSSYFILRQMPLRTEPIFAWPRFIQCPQWMKVISTADLFTYAETFRSRGQHFWVQVFVVLKQGTLGFSPVTSESFYWPTLSVTRRMVGYRRTGKDLNIAVFVWPGTGDSEETIEKSIKIVSGELNYHYPYANTDSTILNRSPIRG